MLVVGLLAALVIYVLARNSSAPEAPDFSGDRRFNFELERLGGKSAIYLASLNRWLGTLWQGTQLAWSVGVLSILIALLCFWLANFLSYPLPEENDETTPPSH